jgi:PEP-CTERM motif
MRRTLLLCLLAFAPACAHADSLTFTLNQTITFSLPLPLNGVAVNGDDLRFLSFPIDFNGHETTGQLDLFSSTIGGGFNLTYDFPGGPGHVIGEGAQLFSGTTADPTISPGNFDLADGKSDDLLTITSDATTPTPEPSTLALFTTGTIGLFLLSTQRRQARKTIRTR